MTPEHRAGCEFRVAGRTLSGTAMRYGDVSPDFRERFEPGAFGEVRTVDINIQHDPALVAVRGAVLTDSPRELQVRAELPPGSAALALVKRGALNGFSVEFNARAERRENGIRVIERAVLAGLALVDRGAFPGATAEVRARSGRRLRSKIPYDAFLACECIAQRGPGSGGECIPMVRFSQYAGELMADALGEAERQRDILAVAGNFRRPLGSVSKGTVRATSTDDGLEVEIDLPAGAIGDEVIAANEAAGVIVRPLIDYDRSEFTDGPDGRTVTRPHLRAFIVGATDTKEGWSDAVIDYGDPEGRAAPERRRRVWL